MLNLLSFCRSIGSILIYNFLILLASAVGFFLAANLQELCEPLRDDAAFARVREVSGI